MSTEIAKVQTLDVMTLGNVLAKSGYFQDARDAAQAVVKVLAGQELGFGPVASMTGIYIVKGRVTLSANLLAAAVKRGGKYNYRVQELTDTACKITFFEGKEPVGESAFTMEDAKAAGLVNDNYKKFARNMLFARAMSNGAKWYCADVFGGPVYTPDELGAAIDHETGEMLTPEPVRPAETVEQQAARLFPDEPEVPPEDGALYVHAIKTRFDTLAKSGKMSDGLQRRMWAAACGEAEFLTSKDVDVSALATLLAQIGGKLEAVSQ